MMYGGAAGPMNTTKGYGSGFNGNKDPFAMASPFARGMYFVAGQRKRMNVVAILFALLVPWLLFCFVYWLLSFGLHYRQPYITDILILLSFLIVVGSSAFFAANAIKKRNTDPTYQPSWYIFIAVTSAAAFVVALSAGEWNYTNFLLPYYDLMNLAHYRDIDTNAYLGQQLMDAGQVDFKKGTSLDLGRSMGFKNHDIYCVAPIVTKGSQAQSVDFWAVGKNCCSGVAADFHCSGFSDPSATGVIRSMHDADRPFYRLAVQQAEATYKMTANHPLFFEWVHSADEATNGFWHKGCLHYFMGVASYFVVQFFLTAVVTLAFSKLVHS